MIIKTIIINIKPLAIIKMIIINIKPLMIINMIIIKINLFATIKIIIYLNLLRNKKKDKNSFINNRHYLDIANVCYGSSSIPNSVMFIF